MYKVVYSDNIEKDLNALDKPIVRKILDKIETYLANDPIGLGKPLKEPFRVYRKAQSFGIRCAD